MTFVGKTCMLAGFAVIALVASTYAAGGEALVRSFRIGEIEAWAIADSVGERNTDVFSGTDPALLAKYMPTGSVPTAIMTFALRVDGKTILIDTGLGNPTGDRASRLMAGLKSAGLDPDAIDVVLITHMHGDHIGGLLWDGGKAFPNADVLIGQIEYDFWLDKDFLEKYPARKGNHDLARSVVDHYGARVKTFAFDDVVAPGVTAMAAVGHTPGHTVFLIGSGSQKLLCIGDLLHAADLQFPHPEINSSYDMDPIQSAASREAFLAYAVAEDIPIAGMHLPFAGVGRVKKVDEGGYRYEPEL